MARKWAVTLGWARQAGLGRAYLGKASALLRESCESESRLGEAGRATLVPSMLACERHGVARIVEAGSALALREAV